MRTSAWAWAWLVVSFLAAGCGCGSEKNPQYNDPDGGDADTDTDSDSDADTDTGTDTGTDTDTGTGECVDASECEPAYGPAPCGAWECNAAECEVVCPGCTDGDLDGYGPEAGACAGADCDDADETVFDSVAPQACYSGPAGTSGTGTCLAGTESCTLGVWTQCVGEVIPSGEACNAQDDDCDGSTDEDLGDFTCGIGACERTVVACAAGALGVCVPGAPGGTDDDCDGVDDNCDGAVDEQCVANCLWVDGTNGNDGTADGTPALSYRTIQAAIDDADPAASDQVCVAADDDANCADNVTFAEAIVMRDGVNVYGSFRETGPNTRCLPAWTTTIAPGVDVGVSFPNTVTSSVLDGFRINRANLATSAGVTVDGAVGAMISKVWIPEVFGAAVQNTYAVDLVNGAEATITRSSIEGGNGTIESIGVRSVGSTPTIRNNCASLDGAGHCDDFCAGNPSIRGRFTVGTGMTYGVLLRDSPGAVIDTSAICANEAETGAAVRIDGDATGTVLRANLVNAFGGEDDSHGIWLEDCASAAPWIVDNEAVFAAGDTNLTRVDGIRSVGDCHPVIDTNEFITGGGEGGAVGANGVHCLANAAGTPSDCVVLGNPRIEGSSFGFPPTAVGVRCDDGSCMRIANNTITGRGGVDSTGIWLDNTGTFVDDNQISGGCASSSATGVYSEDSWARVQNNRISGGQCFGGGGGADSYGLHVVTAAGVNEIDVHSNVIDGLGNAAACTSWGVMLDAVAGALPAAGVGIFRNNVILGGDCNTAATNFYEAQVAADPRIFESNDLDPRSSPTDLYFDADTAGIDAAAGVDALVDMIVSGTLSADPLFVAYPGNLHINAGSPCDAAGTATGAPATDIDGAARDAATPDIGVDEI